MRTWKLKRTLSAVQEVAALLERPSVDRSPVGRSELTKAQDFLTLQLAINKAKRPGAIVGTR